MFSKNKNRFDGVNGMCKKCYVTYKSQYQVENKEKIKQYNDMYTVKNKVARQKYKKKYSLENKDKINQTNKKYYSNNPSVKIGRSLSGRVRSAIKNSGGTKSQSSCEFLGCTRDEVCKYLESKFTTGMTWENHGLYGWHIDHIKPCDSFDLTNPEQQRVCFHYTNLQPLWATRDIARSYGEGPDYVGNLEKHNKLL